MNEKQIKRVEYLIKNVGQNVLDALEIFREMKKKENEK